MEAIIAIGNNNVIGIGNKLAWHCQEDLLHFKSKTNGKDVIVGTTTLSGLPKLPNRHIVQLSRKGKLDVADDICHTPEAAYQKYPLSIVIGGASIINSMLPYIEKLIVTHIDIDVAYDKDLVYFSIPKNYKCIAEYPLSSIAVVREYVKC